MPDRVRRNRMRRGPNGDSVPVIKTIERTEVSDVGGCVVVETRRMGDRSLETTIAPGSDPDPDGPESAHLATTQTLPEARIAHAQAIERAALALASTVRPPDPAP